MIITVFEDAKGAQRRVVAHDLVGGRNLHAETTELPEQRGLGLQKWWWFEGEQKLERLVTRDVAGTAPGSIGTTTFVQTFPPDGGSGLTAVATWSWFTKAEDELLFPKGAEIREMEDVNGEWFFGCYMGGKGLFPASYVRLFMTDG